VRSLVQEVSKIIIGKSQPQQSSFQVDSFMKKIILIFSLVSVLLCLSGIVILWLLLPIQIPIIPSDNQLIDDHFDQKLPGFTTITILDRQGKGSGGDPRILTLQVSLNTGRKPELCEGKLMFFISDPSFLSINWNTLHCTLQVLLVRMAQTAIKGSPNTTCHQEKVASLLTYWVQNHEISIDKIMNQTINSLVKNSLRENKPITDPIHLLDISKMRTKDLDPSLSDEQKIAQYRLNCDGTLDQYLAKDNMTIYSQVILENGFYLSPPLERP